MIFKHFAICSAKLSLSCNDHLVKVKYNEKYKVFKNFALPYRKNHYNQREYRIRHDGIELCASNDSRVQAIWKTGNSWWKGTKSAYCLSMFKTIKKLNMLLASSSMSFLAGSAQSFDKHECRLYNGRLSICAKKLKPATTDLTKKRFVVVQGFTHKDKIRWPIQSLE